MLEIEKIKKQAGSSESLKEIMDEYDRDFLKSPQKEEAPLNPPYEPQPPDDLFGQEKGGQKENPKSS